MNKQIENSLITKRINLTKWYSSQLEDLVYYGRLSDVADRLESLGVFYYASPYSDYLTVDVDGKSDDAFVTMVIRLKGIFNLKPEITVDTEHARAVFGNGVTVWKWHKGESKFLSNQEIDNFGETVNPDYEKSLKVLEY